jgi:hypothetical protein
MVYLVFALCVGLLGGLIGSTRIMIINVHHRKPTRTKLANKRVVVHASPRLLTCAKPYQRMAGVPIRVPPFQEASVIHFETSSPTRVRKYYKEIGNKVA